jgi:hypothetical protein
MCKQSKQENDFYKSKQNLDGLFSYCKECCLKRWTEYNESHYELCLQKAREYGRKNLKKIVEKNKEYRKKNRERYNNYSKKWSSNNLERVKAKQLFNAAKTRARNKKINFQLSIKWVFDKIKNGSCAYTGMKFDLRKTGKAGLRSPSIDRISPSLGYTEENCSVVLWSINAFKNQYELKDIIPIARSFIQYQENNNPANGTQGDPAAGSPPSVCAPLETKPV